MPKVDDAKIKSEHKAHERNLGFFHRAGFRQSRNLRLLFSWGQAAGGKRRLLYGVGSVVAVFAVLSPFIFYTPTQAKLVVADRTLTLDIAKTEKSREKGLGGRESLTNNRGMLFVLDKPEKACLWMKDMRFSIDMVWLDRTRRIIDIRKQVAPNTYPETFCPSKVATYIIEIKAGQADALRLQDGQQLSFK